MVPVSHAPDIKASNSKTPAAHPAPAKTGFQALIDHVARSSHAESAEKSKPPTLEKIPASTEARRDLRALLVEKASLEKGEKPEKSKTEKADKVEKTQHDEGGVNILALALAAKPEAAKTETSQPAQKPRDREAKPLAAAAENTPQPMARIAARHFEPAHVGEEKPKVVVIDKRTEAKEKDKDKTKLEAAQNAVQAQTPLPAPEVAAKSDAVTNVSEAKMVFHPTDQGSPFDIKPQNAPIVPRDAATFQQYLVDKGYGQLVDQARIVLKDNNAGEIRMTLHPESLGKVKVALNLSDGSLAGQIFVENQTVKDVFQSNMDGLLQSFRDGGWSNLSLQVSVGGDQKRQNGDSSAPARDYGRQVAGVQTETPENVRIGTWTGQVNLTA